MKQTEDLSGTWQFALDREGNMKPDAILTETIQLPGTTDTNKTLADFQKLMSTPVVEGKIGELNNISPY
jgi:hypothetical protein